MEVIGSADLGGTLQVSLIDGFSPPVGSSFEIITATDGITGNFASLQLPNLSSGRIWSHPTFDLSGAKSFVLRVLLPSSGDFDGDGDVDGRDFLLWQRGESPNPLSAGDLADWKAHYGQSVSLTLGAVIVPEPSSYVLVILTLAAGAGVRISQFTANL